MLHAVSTDIEAGSAVSDPQSNTVGGGNAPTLDTNCFKCPQKKKEPAS